MILFDVDNTLMDNDAIVRDYGAHLVREIGTEAAERYGAVVEEARRAVGYADYLGALQLYCREPFHDPRRFLLSSSLRDYPFHLPLSVASRE